MIAEPLRVPAILRVFGGALEAGVRLGRPLPGLSPHRRRPRAADRRRFLRRIAQHHHHLDADGREVSAATAEAALHEMIFSGGTLNTRLLGGSEAVGTPGITALDAERRG
jgi:hypothetical protein